jgi:hypothetical protein
LNTAIKVNFGEWPEWSLWRVDLTHARALVAQIEQLRNSDHHVGAFSQSPVPTPSPVVELDAGSVTSAATDPAPSRWGTKHDGNPVDLDTINALVERVRQSKHKDTINRWVKEGSKAGYGWSPKVRGTERAVAVTEAALALASLDDEPVIRALLNKLFDLANYPVGQMLGTLSRTQARHVVHAVNALGETGGLLLTYNDNGDPVIIGQVAA